MKKVSRYFYVNKVSLINMKTYTWFFNYYEYMKFFEFVNISVIRIFFNISLAIYDRIKFIFTQQRSTLATKLKYFYVPTSFLELYRITLPFI